MIRVALIDDHPAVLVGLRRLVGGEPGLALVAAAPGPEEAARQLGGGRADVLVVDYDLARGDGLTLCRRVKERPDPPGVVVYSAYASDGLVLAARAARADAVVDKAAPVATLLDAIRLAARGRQAFPAVPQAAYEAAAGRLAEEDLPVLALLLRGAAPDAIAEALRVDPEEAARRAGRVLGRLRPRLRA